MTEANFFLTYVFLDKTATRMRKGSFVTSTCFIFTWPMQLMEERLNKEYSLRHPLRLLSTDCTDCN